MEEYFADIFVSTGLKRSMHNSEITIAFTNYSAKDLNKLLTCSYITKLYYAAYQQSLLALCMSKYHACLHFSPFNPLLLKKFCHFLLQNLMIGN